MSAIWKGFRVIVSTPEEFEEVEVSTTIETVRNGPRRRDGVLVLRGNELKVKFGKKLLSLTNFSCPNLPDPQPLSSIFVQTSGLNLHQHLSTVAPHLLSPSAPQPLSSSAPQPISSSAPQHLSASAPQLLNPSPPQPLSPSPCQPLSPPLHQQLTPSANPLRPRTLQPLSPSAPQFPWTR